MFFFKNLYFQAAQIPTFFKFLYQSVQLLQIKLESTYALPMSYVLK